MNQDSAEFDNSKREPHVYMGGPPPPGHGPMPPPGAMYQGNVVTTVIPVPMGPTETSTTCVSCNQQIVTKVEYKSSMKTHLIAALLCVFGCWPCACIPYCAKTCRNADHYCPHCNAYIGTHKR